LFAGKLAVARFPGHGLMADGALTEP
jgi:hypothetical protein